MFCSQCNWKYWRSFSKCSKGLIYYCRPLSEMRSFFFFLPLHHKLYQRASPFAGEQEIKWWNKCYIIGLLSNTKSDNNPCSVFLACDPVYINTGLFEITFTDIVLHCLLLKWKINSLNIAGTWHQHMTERRVYLFHCVSLVWQLPDATCTFTQVMGLPLVWSSVQTCASYFKLRNSKMNRQQKSVELNPSTSLCAPFTRIVNMWICHFSHINI